MNKYIKKGILFDENIQINRIKLIDENKVLIGLYNKTNAISIAKEQNKNLIQIASLFDKNEEFAVCIINDLNRFIYEKNKTKKKSTNHTIKEMTIRTKIDLSDMVRKLEFLVEHVDSGEQAILVVRRHRHGKDIIDFVQNYFAGQLKIDAKVSRKSERETRWTLSKKK